MKYSQVPVEVNLLQDGANETENRHWNEIYQAYVVQSRRILEAALPSMLCEP